MIRLIDRNHCVYAIYDIIGLLRLYAVLTGLRKAVLMRVFYCKYTRVLIDIYINSSCLMPGKCINTCYCSDWIKING